MTTRTVPAATVSTRDRLVQLDGERRKARKVCEINRNDGQITFVLTCGAGLSRLTVPENGQVEVQT